MTRAAVRARPARRLACLSAALLVLAGPAPAAPPETSLRPETRDLIAPRAAPAPPATAPRPTSRAAAAPGIEGEAERSAAPTGPLCGDPTLRGAPLPEIPGRIAGCGLAAPVRVTHAGGLALSQPATLDCRTARTLAAWVRDAVRPVIGTRGGGVTGLAVAAHYICRTRNNRPGARVSEHGRGRAIDISAFLLSDGTRIAVLSGWRDQRQRRLLRQLHHAACGPFGTVLGPESDRYHQDHFHLDTARYRSGSYCR